MMRLIILIAVVAAVLIYVLFFRRSAPPIYLPSVPRVDLERFMGDWYVIANIPTFVEKGARNAIEHYDRRPDGTINIRFSFDQAGKIGKRGELKATGYVLSEGNGANWEVEFFWPIRMPYQVIGLADDYSHCMIGVPNREYLWIMARAPKVSESAYRSLVSQADTLGFDTTRVQLVPQIWPSDTSRQILNP